MNGKIPFVALQLFTLYHSGPPSDLEKPALVPLDTSPPDFRPIQKKIESPLIDFNWGERERPSLQWPLSFRERSPPR